MNQSAGAPFSGHHSGDIIDGKYQLDHLAGEGSTGEVWLATNITLDMPVALKLLRRKGRAGRAGAPTLGERFNADLLREAQATARVSHPSIVRVFDFGMTAAGDPFIVMERLEGEDLRDRLLRDGPCPLVHAVQLVLPVIHGMHAAHVRGIVHRDLKPENVYMAIDDSGRALPKVVDFGIANLPWESDDKIIVGTPAYMAPEQAEGNHRADLRADIYSISVVLYELIAGYTPASYRNWPERPNPASDSDDDGIDCLVDEGTIDAALGDILRKGLMRHPAARYRSMRELGEALAEWLLARGVEEDVQGVLLSSNWLCETSGRISEPARAARSPAAGRRAVTPRARPTSKLGRMGLLVAAPLVLLAAGGAVGVAFAARTSEPAALSRSVEARTEPSSGDLDASASQVQPATHLASAAAPSPTPPSPSARVGHTAVKTLAEAMDNTKRRASPPPVLAAPAKPTAAPVRTSPTAISSAPAPSETPIDSAAPATSTAPSAPTTTAPTLPLAPAEPHLTSGL